MHTVEQALTMLNNGDIWAYDTETTGLNTRHDTVIGFGASNGTDSFYIALHAYINGQLVCKFS